ncbi:MAG: 30S ribosomal protein S13 [Candidatus Moranbacteria bacterium]|nr:30S ribosomal protein S13 [Candidatus Moranbacteria bacterium]
MAVRIARVTIPNEKRIEIALTYIYGIGLSRSQKILEKLSVDGNKRTKDLTAEEINKLREELENRYTLEGELKRQVQMNVKRLKENSSYRGKRHVAGLPSRGQRTKTNTRTAKRFRKR